jgi:Flp pilus assembly pilin Flp
MEQGAVRLIRDYLADETGGGAIEYALVATLTSLAIIGSAGRSGLPWSARWMRSGKLWRPRSADATGAPAGAESVLGLVAGALAPRVMGVMRVRLAAARADAREIRALLVDPVLTARLGFFRLLPVLVA